MLMKIITQTVHVFVFYFLASLLRHRCEYFPSSVFANVAKDNEDFDGISSNFTNDELNAVSVKAEVLSDDSSGVIFDNTGNPQNFLEISQKEDNDSVQDFSGHLQQQLEKSHQQQHSEHSDPKMVLNFVTNNTQEFDTRDQLLSRESVESLLRDGDPDLVCERPLNSRHSNTWDRFQIVYYRSIRQNFAKCVLCAGIVS